MNRTIKDATVKRFHDETRDQLCAHLADFMAACNFARRLKTLCGLTPYEYICKVWTSDPDRSIVNPIHQRPGLNISDRAWEAIEPLLPKNQPGARRVDDRRVISGIIHVLRIGCRWEDCPSHYGPSTTIYNRFNRWSRRGLWGRIFTTLAAQAELPGELSIDATAVRTHRSAHGAKGGRKFRPSGARVAVRPPKSMP